MQTTIQPTKAPTGDEIRRAVSTALDGWDYQRYEWGGEWEYTTHLGQTYQVAFSRRMLELEVQQPGDWVTVSFESWRSDTTHTIDLAEVGNLFARLGLPEVGE